MALAWKVYDCIIKYTVYACVSSACAQYMCGTMHKSILDTAQTLLKLMTALYTNLRTSSRLGKQEFQDLVYINKEV